MKKRLSLAAAVIMLISLLAGCASPSPSGGTEQPAAAVSQPTPTPAPTPSPRPNGLPDEDNGGPATAYPEAKSAFAVDKSIYIRIKPDASSADDNIVTKVRNAWAVPFSLLGETGDWYYAEYTQDGTAYRGYVRMQDFFLGTTPPTPTPMPIKTKAPEPTATPCG